MKYGVCEELYSYSVSYDEMTYEEFIININSMLRGTKININNELRQYLVQYMETKYKWYLLNKIFLMKGI